jgi:hypothetical protein
VSVTPITGRNRLPKKGSATVVTQLCDQKAGVPKVHN